MRETTRRAHRLDELLARVLLAMALASGGLACRCQKDAAGWSAASACRPLTAPRTVATIPDHDRLYPPAIAWTGTELAVAWADDSDGTTRLRLARAAKDLTRIGEIAAGPEANPRPCPPSLVWTGAGFGVAWLDVHETEGSVRFARFDTDGRWTGSAQTIEGRAAVYQGNRSYTTGRCMPSPSLVWAGDGFGIAWNDLRSGSTIRFRRLSPDGAPVGSEVAFGVRDAAGAKGVRDPALTWDGSRYGLAWIEDHEHPYDRRAGEIVQVNRQTQDRVLFVAIERDGTLAGAPLVVATDEIDETAGSLATALVRGTPVIVWAGSSGLPQPDDDDNDRAARIRLALIGPSGVELGPVMPPATPTEGTGPGMSRRLADGRWIGPRPWFPPVAVASSGDRLALLWTSFLGGSTFAFGLANADEPFVREQPVAAMLGHQLNDFPPPLVWTGTDWVTAWRGDSDDRGTIRLGRFEAGGERFDEAVLPIAGPPADSASLAIAATRDGFGLVWTEAIDGRPQPVFARVNAEGRVEAGPTIIPDSSGGKDVTLISNDRGFAAAWTDDRWVPRKPDDRFRVVGPAVYFAELDRDGRSQGASVQVVERGASSPHLAWSGDGYGLVWRERQHPCSRVEPRVDPDTGRKWEACVVPDDVHRIRFVRLDRSGRRVGEDVPFERPPEGRDAVAVTALRPAIAWTEGRFAVSWVSEFRPNVVCDCDAEYTTWLGQLDVEGRPLAPFESESLESFPFLFVGVLVPVANGVAMGMSDRPGRGDHSRLRTTMFDLRGAHAETLLFQAGDKENTDGPALASYGDGVVAAWFADRWVLHDDAVKGAIDPPGELVVATVDRDGRIGPRRVTWTIARPQVQTDPVMASSENVYGITWHRYGEAGTTIEFAAVECR